MDTHETVQVKVLLDSGTTGMFIDQQFVHRNGLKTQILLFPIKVYNMDSSLNQGGLITEEVTLMMLHQGHKEKATFEVCDLGKAIIIVSHPWLRKHNPDINWETGQVKMTQCPLKCNVFVCAAKKEHKWKRIVTKWK
jgi:Retroviral aspartyl protease